MKGFSEKMEKNYQDYIDYLETEIKVWKVKKEQAEFYLEKYQKDLDEALKRWKWWE